MSRNNKPTTNNAGTPITNAIVVPRDAIVETEDGKAVYVVESSKAILKSITLGPTQESNVLVTDGLAVGEELIVVGQRDVVDSEEVRVLND